MCVVHASDARSILVLLANAVKLLHCLRGMPPLPFPEDCLGNPLRWTCPFNRARNYPRCCKTHGFELCREPQHPSSRPTLMKPRPSVRFTSFQTCSAVVQFSSCSRREKKKLGIHWMGRTRRDGARGTELGLTLGNQLASSCGRRLEECSASLAFTKIWNKDIRRFFSSTKLLRITRVWHSVCLAAMWPAETGQAAMPAASDCRVFSCCVCAGRGAGAQCG